MSSLTHPSPTEMGGFPFFLWNIAEFLWVRGTRNQAPGPELRLGPRDLEAFHGLQANLVRDGPGGGDCTGFLRSVASVFREAWVFVALKRLFGNKWNSWTKPTKGMKRGVGSSLTTKSLPLIRQKQNQQHRPMWISGFVESMRSPRNMTGLLKRYMLQPFETWLFPPKNKSHPSVFPGASAEDLVSEQQLGVGLESRCSDEDGLKGASESRGKDFPGAWGSKSYCRFRNDCVFFL